MSYDDASEGRRSGTYTAEPTGWVGWIVFAATMMIVLGWFHAIEGLVALFKDDYYAVTKSGLLVNVDYTAWGWTHLILGAVAGIAGAALLGGAIWARVVAVILAVVSMSVNLAFTSAYPVWSLILITVDILVIYAVTVHGSEMRSR